LERTLLPKAAVATFCLVDISKAGLPLILFYRVVQFDGVTMTQIAQAEAVPGVQRSWTAAVYLRLGRLDWRSIAAFSLPFMVYLCTLAPTIYNLDSAELTTAAATGGITRATGYPLYLILGRLWSAIPIGDVGYRMNLLSAFNGAITIALAERILRRLDVGIVASFGSLGLLACAPYFWALSLIAEVYTLHTALMAGLILLLLRWAEQPSLRRLALVGLLGGLGLSHHAMTVLLIPGCAWYVLTVAPRRVVTAQALLTVVVAGLAGFSVYLYLPLRYAAAPAFNYAGLYDARGVFQAVDLRTADGLWWLISGRSFSGLMLAYTGPGLGHEVRQYGIYLFQAFFAIGIGPGLLGSAVLLRRNWRLGGMLLLMFAVNAAFYIDYRAVDKQTMFLPTYLIWALWLGVGYQWLLNWLQASRQQLSPQWSIHLLQAVVVGAVVVAITWNWRLVDLSDDWSTRTRAEAILHQAEPGALIFGWWGTVPAIQYLQLVEGQRPDVQAINRFLIPPNDMRELILRNLSQRPIYVDSLLPDLAQSVTARRAGLVYHLCPTSDLQMTAGKGVVGCN
jgi:hypothetical protein